MNVDWVIGKVKICICQRIDDILYLFYQPRDFE